LGFIHWNFQQINEKGLQIARFPGFSQKLMNKPAPIQNFQTDSLPDPFFKRQLPTPYFTHFRKEETNAGPTPDLRNHLTKN